MSSSTDTSSHVAIVGMACRFPGARDVESFWRNLVDGVDSVTRFPARPAASGGTTFVPARGELADAEWFDAGYFGYSPREADLISPQHRVFLECAVEALEDAGHDPARYDGAIGVYAGGTDIAYGHLLRAARDRLPAVSDWEILLGSAADFLASRVAYKLDLRGPAVAVQAACATSLVAVHTAAQALLAGECDLALAGGVAVHVPAKEPIYSEGGILSVDGICRAFDAGANGTVGGDGAGVVVLRRLDEARAAGDHVYAVVRGSAVTNDGSNRVGFTAPSVDGQAAAIQDAHAVADVSPATITYVEAHGTGTPLGDPIEITALTKAFGGAATTGSCRIGSVKTNIGHTDAAAGMAGLIKATLAVQRGIVPATLHFESPNPRIDFASSPFRVVTATEPWQPEGQPRRAGVSAFGIGGTNAHVVLEQAPDPEPSAAGAGRWHLLPLSAKTPTALDAMTARLADHLDSHVGHAPADVAWTLQTGRRELPCRRFAVVADRDDAVRVLRGDVPERLVTGDGAAQAGPSAPGDDDDVTRLVARSDLAAPSLAMLLDAGRRWLSGAPVNWSALHPQRPRRVPLPTYPFERQRHLVDAVLAPPPHTRRQQGDASPDATRGSETAAAPRDADTLTTVRRLFAETLGLPDVAPTANFFELGGDSLISVTLLARLREAGNVELDAHALTDAPTAAALAALVDERRGPTEPETPPDRAGGAATEAAGWFVCRERRPGARMRLYCFPHAGGSPGEYVRWSRDLPDVEVWGLQLPGRGARGADEPITRMPELVDAIVDAVRFEPPFALFGHSLGGLVAFEIARALRAGGREEPAHVFISSSRSPQAARGVGGALLHQLPDDRLLTEIERRWGPLPRQVHESADLRELMLGPQRSDLELYETYQYVAGEPLGCPMTLLAGTHERDRLDLEGWRAHTTGDVAVRYLPGHHFYLRDQRAKLTGILRTALDDAQRRTDAASRHHVLPLSGRSADELAAAAHRVTLALHAGCPVGHVAGTLQAAGPAMPHRAYAVGQSTDVVAASLDRICRDAPTGDGPARELSRIAFVFPGQGAQYPRMGLALRAELPVFREELDNCLKLLGDASDIDLLAVLQADDGQRLQQTAVTQPLVFAVEYALARTWQALGVTPSAMIGHSLGEYVAATVAGVMSLPDAAGVVAARARLMQAAPPGGMLSVAVSEESARRYLQRGLDLAAVNGDSASVLSGPVETVETLARELRASGTACARLPVSHAYHSRSMEPCAEQVRDVLAGVRLRRPSIPYASNVTGRWLTASEATDPDYWCRHLRQTVRFAAGLETLLGAEPQAVVEVGPGRAMSKLVRQAVGESRRVVVMPSMPHRSAPASEPETLLTAIGRLWTAGTAVNWIALW